MYNYLSYRLTACLPFVYASHQLSVISTQKHPDIASSLSNLAALAQRKKDYPRARILHYAAVSMRRLLLGSSHMSTASSLVNLGALCSIEESRARCDALRLQ